MVHCTDGIELNVCLFIKQVTHYRSYWFYPIILRALMIILVRFAGFLYLHLRIRHLLSQDANASAYPYSLFHSS